jgi:hypothetical protein
MQALIEHPLRLEAVAEHFEQWRATKRKGERIPEALWREAVALVDTHGVSQVSRVLRLGGSDLNRRRGVKGAGKRRQRVGKTPFVEVERASLPGVDVSPPSGAICVELERPDGVRLCIRSEQELDLAGLVGRFLEGVVCCS